MAASLPVVASSQNHMAGEPRRGIAGEPVVVSPMYKPSSCFGILPDESASGPSICARRHRSSAGYGWCRCNNMMGACNNIDGAM
jgi:hypothetical protein